MSKLVLYYADWCPHCVSYKPEWNAIKGILKKNGIQTEEYEHGTHKKEIEAAGVEGFPTLRYFKEGGEIEQVLDRSTAGILDLVGIESLQTGGGGSSHKYKKEFLNLKNMQLGGTGGGDPYYHKYLKYKKKYIDLKNMQLGGTVAYNPYLKIEFENDDNQYSIGEVNMTALIDRNAHYGKGIQAIFRKLKTKIDRLRTSRSRSLPELVKNVKAKVRQIRATEEGPNKNVNLGTALQELGIMIEEGINNILSSASVAAVAPAEQAPAEPRGQNVTELDLQDYKEESQKVMKNPDIIVSFQEVTEDAGIFISHQENSEYTEPGKYAPKGSFVMGPGKDGKRWFIPGDKFKKTYTISETSDNGLSGKAKKPQQVVWAKQINYAWWVMPDWGKDSSPLEESAGAWLIQDEINKKDKWTISDDMFKDTYLIWKDDIWVHSSNGEPWEPGKSVEA